MSKSSFWTDHIESWQVSGLTQREYCQRQAISLASFGYWRGKLRRAAASTGTGLVPMALASAADDASLEVILPNHLSIKIPMTAQPSRVASWIQVLSAC